MLLDFLEKREETIDITELTDEEKLFLKVFGIEENQPVAAMREITYFTCIKKIAEAVAKTPLYLVQDTENGIRRATEDPLNELLSLRPNPYMTAVDFWKAIEATRQHDGISAAVKQYGRKGELLALYPCTIEGMTIDDAGLLKSKLRNKILIEYRVTGSSTTDCGFYEDLLIFKGFTMDGINTKPVRELVKSTIEGQIKAQNYLNNLYDNGLTNKMVVQLTSDIKDEKELGKIQAKFGRLYSKGKRIFTVPAGFSVQPVNLSLADAQYEQIRRMSISQIAALFGVKMHQLNDLKDTNNNSLEQQQLNFLVDTLLILYESIEQEVTWSALTKEKRAEGYKARFNTNVILRTDAKTQQEILCGYTAAGIYKPNESRLELQREKVPEGDELIVNAGVLKLKDIGKNTEGSANNATE
ncbi:phage portal protein [[Ruminococcus] torques]|uniref:phage portal protein n=1 Tax=[Ruminococcus] torques TaxID=33039 RepID=UPI003AB434B3